MVTSVLFTKFKERIRLLFRSATNKVEPGPFDKPCGAFRVLKPRVPSKEPGTPVPARVTILQPEGEAVGEKEGVVDEVVDTVVVGVREGVAPGDRDGVGEGVAEGVGQFIDLTL